MAVDAHVHVSDPGGVERRRLAADMTLTMERNGVDAAIVMPLAGLLSNCVDHAADNDFVFEFCQAAPERLLPAFAVNPLFGEKALAEIERCRRELGLRILKLHPWLQGFSIMSDEMNAVAGLCQRLGVTIVFHDGTPPYCTPLQVARLCRDFPGLKVVSGHSGLNDLWRDALAAAQRYPNFYLALCGVTLGQMQFIVDHLGPEQICVGSDMINLNEDLFWYRWGIWRRVDVADENRDIIEDRTPRVLLGLDD